MIKEAAKSTIGHLKDILNKKNNISDSNKRKIIESPKKYGSRFIKYGCENNLDERIHTIEKMRKNLKR